MNDDIHFDDRRSAAWREAIVETARADRARGGSMRKRVWTIIGLVIAALVVSGGGVAYALSASVLAERSAREASTDTATPTNPVRERPTVIPAPPDAPVDALSAWRACAVIGLANYAADNPGATLQPFDPSSPPTQNGDGTYRAVVGFSLPHATQGAAGMVVICTIGGTLGDPTLVSWTMKDI